MSRYREKVFTVQDICDFAAKHSPFSPTGRKYDKDGNLVDASVEDFTIVSNVPLELHELSLQKRVFRVTNFDFIIDNHKHLDFEWMNYLLDKHKEYASLLLEEISFQKDINVRCPHAYISLERKANAILEETVSTEI